MRRINKTPNPLPSVEYLEECFEYNAETGELYWRERPVAHFENFEKWRRTTRVCAGRRVGTPDGYGHLTVWLLLPSGNKVQYKVHRIVWKMHHGTEPPLLDHIDRDTLNNRIENLREADKSLNALNTKIRTDNTSDYRGVSWDRARGRWRAYLTLNGTTKSLGRFDTKPEAVAARDQAAAASNIATRARETSP